MRIQHFRKITMLSLFLSLWTISSVGAATLDWWGRDSHTQMTPNGVVMRSHRVEVTIDDQIAVTKIEQIFVNTGGTLAEGEYLFPLPVGAAVSDLKLTINGVVYTPQLLDAKEAQRIYTEIVRRRRDPVLLQYVGRNAIRANIFPIPPGEERKIEITYSSIVTAETGIYSYLYPLKTDYITSYPVDRIAVSVNLTSKTAIGTVYSPNPLVAISRLSDNNVRAGFETTNYKAAEDFSLYYGLVNGDINANLLTYRASANEDGYFMLMVTPPTKVDTTRVIAKDVFVVLDQSGSMAGEKWTQAKAATRFVLSKLNPEDRFNVIVFSTGYRIYANSLQPVSEASKAAQWVDSLEALGGTDINLALITAANMADAVRQTTLLFLTDGLPSEGVIDSKAILSNFEAARKPNLRVFSFGVGDDVDTFLLDSLSTKYGGTSVYVRPNENIEQKVSSLYSKINSPVLAKLALNFGAVTVEDMYPSAPLPDLFAGSQLIIVGRYRSGGTATLTLTGDLNGSPQTYTYDGLTFQDNAGGQAFIPRLWATRKIGALLNQIRLNGATPELVDAVTKLSIRYGIITPYTSFLIQENNVVVQEGNPPPPVIIGTPIPFANRGSSESAAPASGAAAVDAASSANKMAGSDHSSTTEEDTNGNGMQVIQQVNDRTFVLRNGVWVDTLYTSDQIQRVSIKFLSDEYFKLLTDHPDIKDYLALGDKVLIVIDNVAYDIQP